MLRLLAALLAALRFLRLAIPFTPCATHLCRTRWCLLIAPERPELYARVLMPIPENGSKGWEQQDLPGSWVTLLCICPALRPRRDRPCQAITTWQCCPNLCDGKGSRNECNFGAQSHGFCNRCLRFAGWVTPAPRKTRFWPPAMLYQVGLATHRVTQKGFKKFYISSSFSRLILALHKNTPPCALGTISPKAVVVLQRQNYVLDSLIPSCYRISLQRGSYISLCHGIEGILPLFGCSRSSRV